VFHETIIHRFVAYVPHHIAEIFFVGDADPFKRPAKQASVTIVPDIEGFVIGVEEIEKYWCGLLGLVNLTGLLASRISSKVFILINRWR